MIAAHYTEKTPNVLVVEDEALIRVALVHALESADYNVHEAATGEEALGLLHSGIPFVAVITDVRMPGKLDGLGLAASVRHHHPALPVIVLTGYTSDERLRSYRDVISAIVSKPYDPADLIALVERLGRERRGCSNEISERCAEGGPR